MAWAGCAGASESAWKVGGSRAQSQNARDFGDGQLVALLRAAMKAAHHSAGCYAKALDYALACVPSAARPQFRGETRTPDRPTKAAKRRARRAKARAAARDQDAVAAAGARTGLNKDAADFAPASGIGVCLNKPAGRAGAGDKASGVTMKDVVMAAEPKAAPSTQNPSTLKPTVATTLLAAAKRPLNSLAHGTACSMQADPSLSKKMRDNVGGARSSYGSENSEWETDSGDEDEDEVDAMAGRWETQRRNGRGNHAAYKNPKGRSGGGHW